MGNPARIEKTEDRTSIPDSEPIFIGIVGLPDDVRVTVGGRDYSRSFGSGATFSHPKDKS